MPSSPPIFSSDFEIGVSSDALSASSHLSARNTGFLPLSDMGPPSQNNPRKFGGFFSPPGGDPMRSQQMFMGSSSRPGSYHGPPYTQTTPYDHVSRMSVPFEEFTRVRNDRDFWRTKYHELKSTHDTVMENIIDNVADISKKISARIIASQTTPKVKTLDDPDAPMTISIASDSSGTSDPPQPSSLSTPKYTRQPLPQLDPATYPLVNHWGNDGYNGNRKGGKRGGEDTLEEKAPKTSVLSSFMEDETGREIPEKVRKAARKTAKQFFQEILDSNRAPANWGEAPRDIENELVHILESEFFWLRLCEGHWKAIKVATNSYSQWHRKALLRKAAAEAKKTAAMRRAEAEVIDVDTDDADETRTSKRPRDEEEEAAGRQKRHRIDEPQPTPRPRPTVVQPNVPRKQNILYEFMGICTSEVTDKMKLTPAVEMIPLTQVVLEENLRPSASGLSRRASNHPPASLDSAPVPAPLETSLALAAAIAAGPSEPPVLGPASNPTPVSVAAPTPVVAPVSVSVPASVSATALVLEPLPTTPLERSDPPAAQVNPGKAPSPAKKTPALLLAPMEDSAGPSASGSGLADNSDVQQDTQVAQTAPKKKATTKKAKAAPKKAKAAPKKAPAKKKFKKLTGKELFYGDWKAANPQKEQVDFENAWKAGRPVDCKMYNARARELNDDREQYEKEEAEKEQAEKEQAEKET
ncbi:hypothetical protein BJ322DRAFT_1022784 [Thelephora terrestris]|uniref:Uncharacterized protein n=1 Tax=Thelephora terrestris TaxID=56493 RepID=A0A9P6HBK7_9AGAM|nr:hypothetical protein BJ322DRAFT_1022784 [Thelephora terrestris]